MFRRWGFLILGTLAAAAIIGASAGAHTQKVVLPPVHVSTNALIKKILASHGIDPKGVVVQHGVWNYAGPSCPGIGWTCTTAKRVIQFGKKDSNNQFQCTPSLSGPQTGPDTCFIDQQSTGGNNDAHCGEQSNSTGVTQSCVIFQSNTTGDNHLDIHQQVDIHGGAVQDATQYAGINQQTDSGKNDAHIEQQIHEDTNDSTGGTQTQDGHQGVSVDQQNGTGDNHADVHQSGALNAEINGKLTGPINQSQDTATTNPTTCMPSSDCPNENVGFTQNSTSGDNDIHVSQSNDLSAHAPKNATGSQTQGDPTDGLNSHMFEQLSTGHSAYHVSQHEHQDLDPNKPGSGLTQSQWGPMWGGSPQGTNPNDVFNLDQDSDQNAGNGATQNDDAFGNCDTSGNCTIDQHINQNRNHQQNSCSGSDCHITLSCTSSGEEPGCVPVSSCDGPCGNPPPPPPPPTPPDPCVINPESC